MPNLTIIIVNWNTINLLKKCVESIYCTSDASIKLQIIIVDNASSDGSGEMIERYFPKVKLIRLKNNLGFAKANNVALDYLLKEAKVPKYVLFLNSDVILCNGSLQGLLEVLEINKKVAAVGPALILPDGKYQVGGAGYGVSVLSGIIYFSLLFKILPKKMAKGLFIDQKRYRNHSTPLFVDWLAGACILVRTKVIEEIGGWDEQFFMYAEDAELCKRIRDAGWQIAYLPYIKVTHYHGASSMHTAIPNTKWLIALFQYMKNKRSFLEYALFRFFAMAGTLIRLFAYSCKFLLNPDDSSRKKVRDLSYYFKASLMGRAT